jgi:excisionase family DNA binding protein
MTEAQNMLTVDETAEYLSLTPETVRRLIRRGELRATKLGKVWRVSREALRRVENAALNAPTKESDNPLARALAMVKAYDAQTPDKTMRLTSAAEELDLIRDKHATAILAGLDSNDSQERNAAILALSQADSLTSALVETEVARSVAKYSGPEDNFSDWRALDGEPFHFPEEEAKA